jgi:8-amino-7-oxononanoate synthase
LTETDSFQHLKLQLDQRKEQDRFRSLRPADQRPSASRLISNGCDFINFSSNDYLGLASHPQIIQKSTAFTKTYGAGASSSRLISGTFQIHTDLEERLADWYNSERALLYNSGFQANSTILAALTTRDDLILADKRCHNSILTGCMASPAEFRRFRHNDCDHLNKLLNRADGHFSRIWVVTESLFSMDGDIAPLEEMIGVAASYGAKVYVDDAHAFGLFGEQGRGIAAQHEGIDLLVSTFGKAGGSFGAFVICSQTVYDALVNFSNGLIYSTALPPPVIGAMDAALDLIPGMTNRRNHITELQYQLKNGLKTRGLNTGESDSHIIPIIFGDDAKALSWSQRLLDEQILAVTIRPPTVPEGESRIRLSLTSEHSAEQIQQLLRTFDES